MAFTLTATAQALANQISKTPQIIVEVEGIDTIYGTSSVFKFIQWDDGTEWDQDGITWDGVVANENSLDAISFKKTTKNITQQIRPDKGAASSISTMTIELIDFNKQVSSVFALDSAVEQLGKKARVYLSFEGAAHPENSIPVFFGFIDDFSFEAGKLIMSVSHPENLKRQSIFSQYQSTLTAGIDDSVTTIPVADTTGIIPTRDSLTSYIQIEDEAMEVVSTTSTTITVIRERLGTIAASHATDTEILSILTLEGLPIDLALKIMLSDSDNSLFSSAETIESFEYISASESVNNAIIFSSVDIQAVTGLVNDDIIEISGSTSNDGTYTVRSFSKLDDGRSYIVVNENLTLEASTTATWSYKSQYNVLSDGLGMLPDETDVETFIDISETFGPNFVDYSFIIKETVDSAKDFIDREIFFPQNIYSIPRKARSSCKFVAPPLSIEVTPVLDTTTIKNPQNLSLKRSTHRLLYNSVTYRYNKILLSDKFFTIKSVINTDSLNRIKVGSKPLRIDSTGLIDNPATTQALDRLSARALDRYKFAATEIKGIKLLYKDGFNIEIGDVVLFGSSDMQIPDIQTGGYLEPKLYEVSNKSLNIEKGSVTIDITETGFALENRRGVFSPSSLVDTGSTTSRIIVKAISTSDQFLKERDKWNELIGVKVRVRSDDYTFDEETTITSFDTTNDAAINISPALPSIATDYVVELVDYGDLDNNTVSDTAKLKYTFSMKQAEVTVSTDNQNFDVDDTSLLFIGQKVQVHSEDYTRDSVETTIANIATNTITLTDALSFTPLVGDFMETISFADGGDGYVYL